MTNFVTVHDIRIAKTFKNKQKRNKNSFLESYLDISMRLIFGGRNVCMCKEYKNARGYKLKASHVVLQKVT